jgi:hypothetical protein
MRGVEVIRREEKRLFRRGEKRLLEEGRRGC